MTFSTFAQHFVALLALLGTASSLNGKGAPFPIDNTESDADLSVQPQLASTSPPSKAEAGDIALRALKSELAEASGAWVKKYQQAKSDKERAELNKVNPYRQFERRFLSLARAHAGKPAALEAIQWLADSANPGSVFDEGLALAEQYHLEDEGMATLCRTLASRRTPRIERFLLAVAKKHPNRDVQGVAYLSLARYLKKFFDTAEYVRANEKTWLKSTRAIYSNDIVAWIRAADPSKLSQRVDALCKTIVSEYGDVNDREYRSSTHKDRSLADAAKALSFSLHAVGSLAPKTTGTLADGSRLRLNNLRGRVVLLMFSANWCGPCKKTYGQLREMMELYAQDPFTVVTVMADTDRSTVSKAVNSGEITWPAIWDGANGPIASAWNTTSYPTIYLIDREGRIKSRGLHGDALDDEVARMLDISDASRVKVDKRKRVWRLSLSEKKIKTEELPAWFGELAGFSELRILDLSHNPIVDESLRDVLPLKKLHTLRLEHTGITDRGLQHLRSLTSLKSIILYAGPGHRTTKAGRRRLRQAIAGLKISIVTN